MSFQVTSKRTLANYMIWLYTSTWNFQLDERYDDIHQVILRKGRSLIAKEGNLMNLRIEFFIIYLRFRRS